jgi:hypothetical protein
MTKRVTAWLSSHGHDSLSVTPSTSHVNLMAATLAWLHFVSSVPV